MMIMTKEEKVEEEKKKKRAAAPKAKAPKKAEEAKPEHRPHEAAEHKGEAAHEAHAKTQDTKHDATKAPEAKAHEAHKAAAAEHKAEKAEAAPAAPKKKASPKAKKKEKKVLVVRGKRKESIARATIQQGKGIIRINRVALDALGNKYVREIVREPLRYVGPEANSVDISVNVCGGGSMGQAQAARTAIAHALVEYFEGMNLKEKFYNIDRTLLVEDTRRVEPKKFRGPKARARFQKSYR